jgi:hypothetical protein
MLLQKFSFSSKLYNVPKKNFEKAISSKLNIKLELLNFDEIQNEILYPKVKIKVKVKSLFDTNQPFTLEVNELFDELELKHVLLLKSRKYQFYDIVCIHTDLQLPHQKVQNIFELLNEKDILHTVNQEEIFHIWLKSNSIGKLIVFLSYATLFSIVLYFYLNILE